MAIAIRFALGSFSQGCFILVDSGLIVYSKFILVLDNGNYFWGSNFFFNRKTYISGLFSSQAQWLSFSDKVLLLSEEKALVIITFFLLQVHEVLKLLNELLPTAVGDEGNRVVLDKKSFLADHPDFLQKFGMDILPTLVQVLLLDICS